ncbi:MAG: HD domain-containing protein [Myxococcales bacterium]|nr:HD domain-containing protein [Myxococcales bacterium]
MARFEIAPDAVPEPVLEVCERISRAGHGAWAVGGCVRDLLLGRGVSDWDVATSARPEEVAKIFRRVIPTGVDHGTVTVLWKGEPYEVTTLRGEGAYSDGRRPDEVFFVHEIEEDLARRDFTVNAIAYDPLLRRLFDPHRGLEDLERGQIRAVGLAEERFAEDGLRILRAARFVATLEFELEAETEAAIPGAVQTFRKVSRERVQHEWMKTMRARAPSRAFDVMRRTGILKAILPELLEQVGCEQNRWHAYDVWQHTMATLDASGPDPIERMAALLHDLGKPMTREFSEKTQDHTFYGHERVGADLADRWLRDFRFSNEERRHIVHLIRQHLVCYSSEWTDAGVRRFLTRVGVDSVGPLLRLARADALGKGRPVEEELARLCELEGRIEAILAAGQALSAKDLAIGGRELMQHLGLEPGPAIGRLIASLLDRVVEEPSLNDRDRLLSIAAELLAAQAADPALGARS